MLELLGLGFFITLLFCVRKNKQPYITTSERSILSEELSRARFAQAQQVKQELIWLISRVRACQTLNLPSRIEEIKDLSGEIEVTRKRICAVDDDELLIIGQLYDLFDEARIELNRVSSVASQQTEELFAEEAKRRIA